MSLFKNVLFSSAVFAAVIGLSTPRAPVGGSAFPAAAENDPMEVMIYSLTGDPRSGQPVVLLSDPLEERVMPIWIGPFEAAALDSEMKGTPALRPQTHDLFKAVMLKAGLEVRKIAITHLKGSIYHASLWIERGGSLMEVDSRPSDALVMALKFEAPVFVSRRLFEDKSIPLDRDGEEGKEEPWHQAPGHPV